MRPDKPQFWTGGGGNIAMTEMTGVGRWEPIKNLTERTLVDVNIDCRGMLQGVARVIQDGEIIDITTSRVQKNIFATPSQSLNFETLSIPTGSFSFSRTALDLISGSERNPVDMMYNNDGTRLYVLEQQHSHIVEYSLTTPYDISTGIFTRIALNNVGTQDTSPFDMMYNNDGTNFFVLRDGTGISDNIRRFELSTPYDILTATFITGGLNVNSQDASPRATMFNNDGTRLYLLGTQHNNIFEYGLTTPYDISTGTFTRIALNVGAQDTSPFDMMYNNDGTKLYVLGAQHNNIFEYGLTTPYDISTATYTRIVINNILNPTSILFNNDETKLYVIINAVWPHSNNRIFEYLSGTIWTGNVKIRTLTN